ncbi:MAG: ATP-binding protein [Candidatus Methanoperedens sp.]|nr:ATP-binding protein [Candidatus Methanoperedens sp.]
MLFRKPFSDIEYSDIEDLKKNKIAESLILDYKDMKIDDKNFVKEVTAFSNTGGGFLIYGIKETSEGGYPESINGIDDCINLESLEQTIIGNVRPSVLSRLNCQMRSR